jgi:dinuclear metal center YbgI/SA1388 family protein
MTELKTVEAYCNDLLRAGEIVDYCPNGIQVEAGQKIERLISGVTACQALIDAAVEKKADALLVHHGYFWKGEAAPLTGIKGRRIRTLMQHGISLLAYHLPLDLHPGLGNNRQLALRLGFEEAKPAMLGDGLIWQIDLNEPLSPEALKLCISKGLGQTPLHIAGGEQPLQRIGWCTGAAQSHIEEAAVLGLDAYITGEISEQTVHLARELGIHFFAAGHHATERYGVEALGCHLAEHFDIDHVFIDIPNPV